MGRGVGGDGPIGTEVALDVLLKVGLFTGVAMVLLDPSWGNLEGKAPTARAVTYPLVALALPLWWALRRPRSPFPWLADLLLTITGFSDLLGNRLDLYDRLAWFDDVMHLIVTACVSAALVLATMHRTVSGSAVLQRSVALGMTAALAWEVFEFLSFVTDSASEHPTAYSDTVGDLLLGWVGTLLAAGLVHARWRHHLPDRGAAAPGELERAEQAAE